MSDTRQAALIHALVSLQNVLSATTAGTDNRDLRLRGQRYLDLATYIVANVTTAIGQGYATRVPDEVMHSVSFELNEASNAAANGEWERVVEHARSALNVLPGDPISYPKGNLPPL